MDNEVDDGWKKKEDFWSLYSANRTLWRTKCQKPNLYRQPTYSLACMSVSSLDRKKDELAKTSEWMSKVDCENLRAYLRVSFLFFFLPIYWSFFFVPSFFPRYLVWYCCCLLLFDYEIWPFLGDYEYHLDGWSHMNSVCMYCMYKTSITNEESLVYIWMGKLSLASRLIWFDLICRDLPVAACWMNENIRILYDICPCI